MKNQMLSAGDFGAALIRTGDLDPIYAMLVNANENGEISREVLKKWLVAYWFFYHAGVASELATARDFWRATAKHAAIPSGLRGTERRHFRAEKATTTIAWFRERYAYGSNAIDEGLLLPLLPKLSTAGAIPFSALAKRAQTWPQFGPWIAFKIADMIDCVLGVEVDFSDCALSIYSEPLKGGYVIDAMASGLDFEGAKLQYEADTTEERVGGMKRAIALLQRRFAKSFAPPHYRRKIGIQEIETMMCKYKSHLNGHYPVGHDIIEVRNALAATGGKLATNLAKFLP